MKIRAFALVIAAMGVLLSACGKNEARTDVSNGPAPKAAGDTADSSKNTVYGTWTSPRMQLEKEGYKFSLVLRFESNRMTAINTCTDTADRTLTAQVSVPATITASTIDVKETKEVVEKRGGFTCRVSIDRKGLIRYKMPSKNALVLEGENGNPPLELERVIRVD